MSTSLLQRTLRIGYGNASAILDGLLANGFIGQKDEGLRSHPVLIDVTNLHKAIEEEIKFADTFDDRMDGLFDGEDYKYIVQFARKFKNDVVRSDLETLSAILKRKRWDFSIQELKKLVSFEFYNQEKERKKTKIIRNRSDTYDDILASYLNSYSIDDRDGLIVLNAILKEEGKLSGDIDRLKIDLEMVKNEKELDLFENRLLDESDLSITISEVDLFDGYEFEAFLGKLYLKMGYEIEPTRLSGDQGADLVVVKFGEKTVIQAKCYSGKVGNKAVQEILASMSLYQAQKGSIVTNNYYTRAAFELADANDIELIDRDGLEKLIRKYW